MADKLCDECGEFPATKDCERCRGKFCEWCQQHPDNCNSCEKEMKINEES